MSPHFPLLLLPRRVVYVDDDEGFLSSLRAATPHRFAREYHSSPTAAALALREEQPYWDALHEMLAQAPVARAEARGEASFYVERYFRDWRRFRLTSLLIVDYAMPGLNGLDLVTSIGAHTARRLLLTGQADAGIGVAAFNAGLIQKFVPKAAASLGRELRASYAEMHRAASELAGRQLRLTLDQQQVSLLNQPAVISALQAKVEALGWEEYIVCGQPFGLLGMGRSGPLQWLQLETPESFAELAGMASAADLPVAQVEAVKAREAIAIIDLWAQLRLDGPPPAAPAEGLCQQPLLYAGVVDLPCTRLTWADYGMEDLFTLEDRLQSRLRDVEIAHAAGEGASGAGLRDAITGFRTLAARAPHGQQLASQLLAAIALPSATLDELRQGLESRDG